MKNLKWISICLLLVMLTVAAVDGSFGDESANTTYLTIVQSQLQRDGAGLCQVTDDRALLPVTEEDPQKESVLLEEAFSVTDKKNNTTNISLSIRDELYSAANVLDNIVVVTNTGNTDGYVRTWFAFEMGDLTEEEFTASILLNQNRTQWTWDAFAYGVMIDGQRYAVVCAEYAGKLSAAETTAPNLLQILLKNEVSRDIVSRLDGNHDGKYEVRACSQVVSDNGAWSQVSSPW